MGHVYNLKKQFKVQIIGVLEEMDSFYWQKMQLWKGGKKIGQGPSSSSQCERWYCPISDIGKGSRKKAAVLLDYVQITPPLWTTFLNAKNVDLSDIENDSSSKILLK